MTGSALLSGWAVGLGVGLLLLTVVVVLLNRVLRPVREIERYTADTLAAVEGVTRNLEGATEIERTRDVAATLSRTVSGR